MPAAAAPDPSKPEPEITVLEQEKHDVKSRLVDAARQVKHQGLVAYKRVRPMTLAAGVGIRTKYYDLRVGDYDFEYGRYNHEFVNRQPPPASNNRAVPHVIYCLWTGDNDITPRRSQSLELLRQVHEGVPVTLITPDNLADYLVDGHPLHPAYEYLSYVHRSDYLRAYLMHHHGGGYSDIKRPLNSWAPCFDAIAEAPQKWAVGYRELDSNSGARLPRRIGRDVRRNYARVIGQSGFIFRPDTSLTAEWMRELDNRMNYYADALSESPGNAFGDNLGYPIGWTGLLGKIISPLLLKYHERLIIDNRMLLAFSDYR